MGGSTLTLAQMCDAIESELSAATGIARSQSYDELTEGIHEDILLQVWPQSGSPVSTGSNTQKLTLGNDVIAEEIIIFADLYRPRRHLGEDMKAIVDGVDGVREVMKEQDCPPFDLTGIRTFKWSWAIGSFEYQGVTDLRGRFTIVLNVF
jgi:hypothetical protein